MIQRIFFTTAGIISVVAGFLAMQDGKFYYRGYVVDLSENKISLGIFLFVFAGVFLFLALRGNRPEKYVMCASCTTPFRKADLEGSHCPACGGTVEDLDEFYNRHPEMKTLHKKLQQSFQKI